ncbi:MAG: glycosyltransferase [Acidobacteriota bacterium]
MIFAFYGLACILVYFSIRSALGGIKYIAYFRQEIEKRLPLFTPFVTMIVPCRGVDPGMDLNLAAFLGQEYPAYEVIFVVDHIADPAVPIIEDISQNKSVSSRLVVAPDAIGCGQKVENLREAVLHADVRSEALVFVDSDTRPAKMWLRHIVAPLEDTTVGASTGYRWFISKDPTFSSELRSVWNASIASTLGPKTRSNFCWGGAMAIRRDTFDRLGIRSKWAGTLSDDLALTRALNAAGLPIVFVPQALTASIENCSFSQMLEFTTRQIKITRVYAQPLWILSFMGSGLFLAVMLSACLIIATNGAKTFAFWFSVAVIVVVTVASFVKSWLRLSAVALVLTQHSDALRRQRWSQNTLWAITPALFFYNCAAALISRRMTWRGISYELKSPTETVIISGEAARR